MKRNLILAWVVSLWFATSAFAQTQTQTVTGIHYFFDTDPGVGVPGNGAILSVTPTSNYMQSMAVTVPNTLTPGFHNLYVRARDEFGRWSLAERRLFYISSTFATQDVSYYQYFFDTDPGVGVAGNGAIVPITQTPDYTASASITVPNTLTTGFHNLYIRTRDVLGRWSLAERRLFYINPAITATQDLIAYQYFFDTDPGVGVAGNGAIVSAPQTADFDQTVSITVPNSLSSGFHHLYIRTKDASGRWSLIERRAFYISTGITATADIDMYQYFFDTDPGVGLAGNGAAVPVTQTADFNQSVSITVPNTLNTGFHYLYIRTRDVTGRWSLIERRAFYINTDITATYDIDMYQYYFDADPGVGLAGNGAIVPISQTDDFNQSVSITVPNTLSTGFHYLYIRTRDVTGRWSLNERRFFYINNETSTSQTVSALEFYYDTDPGVGNGNPIPLEVAAEIDGVIPIGVPCLSTGTHYLYVRAKDEFGRWSIIERDTLQVTSGIAASDITPAGPVSLCMPNSVTLTTLFVPGIDYQWLLEGNNIPGATSNSYVVTTTGNYSLKSTCGSSFVTSNVVSVSIVSELTYYADSDNDGYGDATITTIACTPPAGFVANGEDCDDGNMSIHPGATETCNGIDDDCDGVIDEETEAPVISNCPADITLDSETGQWGAHASWIEPTASDNCDVSSFSASHSSGDFFTAGNTIVTYTALDVNGNSSTCSFNVTVSPPNILGTVNLSIFANDIQFSNTNPAPGTFINVSATVHNNSNVAAISFVCHLLNQYSNISYPDITVPSLAANQSTVVTWNIQTPAVPAFVPMQVKIDYLDNVAESNELDNQAIRPFVNGTLPFSGQIVVVASAIPYSAIAGSGIAICGNAYYDDTAIPLTDSSVAGAQVTVAISETGQVLNGVTNSNGDFCIGYSTPNTAGLYHFSAAVTDFTLTGDTTGTFLLTPPPIEYCPTDLSIGMELFGSLLCGNGYNIVQGSSLSGIVHITNSCQAVSVATTLFIALPDGTPVPGPYIIPSLLPGETYSVALPEMTFNTVGSTFISATADFFNAVTEDNESNNSRSIPIHVYPPVPDIMPSQGWVSSRYQCTQASVSFKIENMGGVPTGAFNTILEIYHENTLEASFTQPVNSIPARCYEYVSFVFSPLYSGSYHFNLYCDTMPNVVTELSDFNNSLSMTHYFQACNLDLVVHGCGSMDVKPTNPVTSGSVTLYASIGNYGQLPVTDPFVVNFDVAGTIYPVSVNQTIPANGTINVTVTVPKPALGNNDLIVEADANHVVTELDETNNANSAKLCWDFILTNSQCYGGPPFRSTQFICNPIQLAIGVLNHGLYEATNLQVKFEVSGPGISGWFDLGYTSLFIDNTCGCPLVVGLPSAFLFPQTGSYQVRITADSPNLYVECFEDNNQIVLPVNVVENADYAVYSQFIAPSDLNPDINEEITFNLTYKNEGCTGLSPIELYMQMDNTPHDSVPANALTANATNTYSMSQSWSSALPGVHVIRSVIDHDQAIAEGNELNNEATRSIIVGGAPNFNVFELVASNLFPASGESILLTASVMNEGQSGGDGTLQFYFVNAQGEEVLIEQQAIHLAEAETVVRTVSWFVTYPAAKIIARVSNVTPLEFDFTDNEQTLQLNNLSVVIASTDVACNGVELGILDATVTGGQAPYFMQWSNGYTGSIINVPAGIYSVLVTDANGLTATKADTVNTLAVPSPWYADADGDGFGNPSSSILSCTTPQGYVTNDEDCNDADATISPQATEGCDGVDNDCDGLIDDDDTSVVGQALWYHDLDGDSYGNPDIFVMACFPPAGYIGNGTDCDDNDASKHPDANEVLDGKDNDCDGMIDEGLSVVSVDAGDCMVVYHGYAPTECAVLNANAQGGAQPYTYDWSNGAHTASTIVCPAATTIYEVTVTDHNGSTSLDVVTVQVIDISCGNNKVSICHIPPGNPSNVQTLCISVNAVATHLNEHGDYLGSCDAPDPCDVPTQPVNNTNPPVISLDENHTAMNPLEVFNTNEDGIFAIYPNPANTFLELQLPGATISYEVTLHDVTGKLVLSRSFGGGSQRLSTTALDSGIYILQIRSVKDRMTSAIVVMH